MAHSYTEQLLAVYPDRVQTLGKALGINEERLKVGIFPWRWYCFVDRARVMCRQCTSALRSVSTKVS